MKTFELLSRFPNSVTLNDHDGLNVIEHYVNARMLPFNTIGSRILRVCTTINYQIVYQNS